MTSAYKHYVNNTSGATDSYDLSTTSAIPAGYSVAFYNDGGAGTCATLGTVLTNTGPVAAGANKLGLRRRHRALRQFRQCDTRHHQFYLPGAIAAHSFVGPTRSSMRWTVNTAHNITMTPNGVQQTFPGNAVTYTHTLKNLGNSSENVTFASGFLTDSQTTAGWTSSAYVDTNGNGVYDAGTDALITTSTTLAVAANATQTIFVRVFAPGSATAISPADVTTLTASYNSGTQTVSVTDTTSVTNGLLLSKAQSAGTCAAGMSAGPFSTAAISAGANTAPGKCVAYQITAANTSTAAITNVALSDIVPSNTTLAATSCFAPTATGGGDDWWHRYDGRLDRHSDRNTGQPGIRRFVQPHLLREDQPIR